MVALLPPAAPLSGWWLDQPGDCLLLFHGTDICNVFDIAAKGLLPINGHCYVTPDYKTARDYAMLGPCGGDFAVIQRRTDPLRIVPDWRMAVLHFSLPRDYISRHAIHSELRPILQHRELYEASAEPDSRYYYLSELSFAEAIPPKHILGYSLPRAYPYDKPIYRISR